MGTNFLSGELSFDFSPEPVGFAEFSAVSVRVEGVVEFSDFDKSGREWETRSRLKRIFNG